MKLLATVFTALIIAACGSPNNGDIAGTGGNDSDVTFCSCVNEPILTDAKANACGAMVNAMAPEDVALETRACRQQVPVPAGGPDLCFCLRSSSTDLELRKACEEILPKNISPRDIADNLVACGK